MKLKQNIHRFGPSQKEEMYCDCSVAFRTMAVLIRSVALDLLTTLSLKALLLNLISLLSASVQRHMLTNDFCSFYKRNIREATKSI